MSLSERIAAITWHDHAQPEWNKTGSVQDAVLALYSAGDAKSSSTAYDRLLYAVGNNHAGTYYPVLLAVVPFLEEVLQMGQPWPTRTVLSVLDDLCGSFQPEPGYETVQLPSGEKRQLAEVFREEVMQLCPLLAQIAQSDAANSVLAAELLVLLHEDQD